MLYISHLFLEAAKRGRDGLILSYLCTVQAEVAPSCAQPLANNARHVLLDPEKYEFTPTPALMRKLGRCTTFADGCIITRAYLHVH